MKELIRVTENGVDGRALYAFLDIKHRFNDWIGNSVRDYGFEEGKDFYYFSSRSEAGRKTKEYALTIEMAKELSMVAKTPRGKQARRYFIQCEKIAKRAYQDAIAARVAGKIARRSLTDEIRDKGENDRMHGHAYSTYSKLAYKLTGIEKGERETLNPEDLERLENVESLMRGLLKAGKDYSAIKDALTPLLT